MRYAVFLTSVAVTSAILAMGAIRHLSTPMKQTPQNQSPLTVPTDALKFGETWESEKFEWTLPVKNISTQEVRIARWSASCSCVSITPTQALLQPGESIVLRVTLDLRSKQTSKQSTELRPFATTIKPVLEAEASHKEIVLEGWSLEGSVRPSLLFDRKIALERISELSQPIPNVKFQVRSLVAMERLTADCEPTLFTATVERDSTDPIRWQVQVRPPARLPIGRASCKVYLMGRTREGAELPRQSVDIFLDVMPDVEVYPAHVGYGARVVGTRAEERLGFRSLSGRPVDVKVLRVNGEGMTVVEESDAHGSGFRITQTVSQLGQVVSTVVFEIKTAEGVRQLHVPVTVYGTAP